MVVKKIWQMILDVKVLGVKQLKKFFFTGEDDLSDVSSIDSSDSSYSLQSDDSADSNNSYVIEIDSEDTVIDLQSEKEKAFLKFVSETCLETTPRKENSEQTDSATIIEDDDEVLCKTPYDEGTKYSSLLY